ncbi:TetR family transcriptional regulator [Paenibacillus rhizophilus]|uniref:TetR family transcriptional regulator n=1 Tax=Paenibacillus rhizophilus TaxID=1850366 RepID=A0A3N9NWM8_9BACL|nr:TetR family transcriptional regulator [Paenibacillus rhizophilus]RQW08363.1 TetR family transcriptional regulator [Paenibacillus rhizophilus]
MPDLTRPKVGLRERKKIKTKASIQQNALRLFREQGYQATTVEQIAEAAEISPSTFFRYFATKEAVVLEDDYDPLLIETYRNQPPELDAVQAFRNAVREGFLQIPEEEQGGIWERVSLVMSVPELRIAMIHQIAGTTEMVAGIIAERAGREAGELKVRNVAAAVIGLVISAQMYYVEHPEMDFLEILDESLAHMQAGFPL